MLEGRGEILEEEELLSEISEMMKMCVKSVSEMSLQNLIKELSKIQVLVVAVMQKKKEKWSWKVVKKEKKRKDEFHWKKKTTLRNFFDNSLSLHPPMAQDTEMEKKKRVKEWKQIVEVLLNEKERKKF